MNRQPLRRSADMKVDRGMRDISPVVFRGEPDNRLRERGDWQRPWYFAEAYSQAKLYAGNAKWPDPKDEPVACVLAGRTVVDLTAPDPADARHRAIVDALTAEFDDWTCRRSGEPRDAWSFLEAGDLYDYEGTGSGQRWNALFRIAFEHADAVRVLDMTDGTKGQPVPVWVTHQRDTIRLATLGEELGARLDQQPWEAIEAWLEAHHPQAGVLERVDRMRRPDHDQRADRVHRVVPPRNFDHGDHWRAAAGVSRRAGRLRGPPRRLGCPEPAVRRAARRRRPGVIREVAPARAPRGFLLGRLRRERVPLPADGLAPREREP